VDTNVLPLRAMCSNTGCTHAPVTVIDGQPYCGTDAWPLMRAGNRYDWYTDATTRCAAVWTSPHRDAPIQCTRDHHTDGSHLSLYTNTAWPVTR